MTTTIDVRPKQDFWHRLSRTRPLRAISEMVWNALDADADNVSVDFRLNPLGGLQEITIADDGSGIPFDVAAEHRFAALGGSWKARAQRTSKRRQMQGRFGEGRFRSFALGEIVSWATAFRAEDAIYAYEIMGSTQSPGKFVLTDKRASPRTTTGTTVSIKNPEPGAGSLLSGEFHDNVARVFAPHLLKYRDVKLKVNGKAINTDEIVDRQMEYPLDSIRLDDGQILPVVHEIVEWKSIKGRALYLCDENGFALSERSPEVRAPGFNFGAYLKSRYFAQLDEGALVDMDLADGMGRILAAARTCLGQYFKKRELEKTQALIDTWKAEGIYPYPDVAASRTEDKARQVFDICAVTVSDYVDGFNEQATKAKALSFRLLKEAIESGSPELSRILSEVLLLPQNKQKEFSALLDKAKLTNIIDSVNEINTRITIAAGLRSLVCSDDIRDSVKEREHIHRIVEANPWLFGEQYALGRSETSLTNMLREHLSFLKRDTRITEPVLKAGGKSGRIDIMLVKLIKISGRSDDNHLVIELKRANKKLSHKDFSQIFDYANSVIQDVRFNKTQVSWDFWLVGVETDEALNELCNSQDRPAGCAHIFKTGRARIWVKSWGEIVHDCLSRHEYIRSKLELEVEEEDSVSYLRELYMKVITPENVAGSRRHARRGVPERP